MDELAKYNQERWDDLAKAIISFSRHLLYLTTTSARQLVDPQGILT
jgi:hypothetical protein